MKWRDLTESLSAGRQNFDRQLEVVLGAAEENSFTIHCRDGCGNCCTLAVNCSFPEAVTIAAGLTAEQKAKIEQTMARLQQISRTADNLKQFLSLFRKQAGGCPFLDRQCQSCEIYPLRPFSCRSLLSTRPASWCGVDFSTLHPLEKQAFISSLDPTLVAFPTHYLAAPQELGAELEAHAINNMRDSFGFGLSGNLIYLVWLELQDHLSTMIATDAEAARKFIVQKQLKAPFLLQLSE